MLSAEVVLKDFESAMRLAYIEDKKDRFKLYWVAAISLARTIGHVLHKVDSEISNEHKKVISARYEAWKANREEHKIFWEFIENERNNLLKEYEFGFLAETHTLVVVDTGEEFDLDWQQYCPMTCGAYQGEDCRIILEDVASWWLKEISLIKSELPPNKSSQPPPYRGG